MRRFGLGFIAPLILVSLGLVGPATAATDLNTIADELRSTGRYLEVTGTADLDAAIDRANERGIAFAWLDSDEDAEAIAQELSNRLGSSSYRTVLVLTNAFVGAWSSSVGDVRIEEALDASGPDFTAGAVADGIDDFSTALSGQSTATSTGGSSSSGGPGLGTILLVAAIGGGGFLLIRNLRNRGKAKKQAEMDLETDRAEIKEQLRDNADHVLNLGDRVIEAENPDLITTYEQASAAYQDVSQSIDDATTAEEIDRLDDKIDLAEWQFESIEAELEGRPVPPSPQEIEAQAEAASERQPAPPVPSRADRSARGADRSVIDGRAPGRPVPQQRTPSPGRRRGGMGGGLGGVLGGILGNIVLGGGLGGTGSRRSQRRRSQQPRGGGSMGGLGGGVLRRSGGSRAGTGSSSRRGSGGSRSLGRRSGGGGSRRL